MSLHAELSPEAQARLHAQRRNSTISSVVIAVLTVVLFALILGILLLPPMVRETPTIVTYEANLDEQTEDNKPKVQTNVTRKPTPPSSNLAKVIVANTASPTSVPVPAIDVSTPSLDFGDIDLGDNWGDSGPQGFGNIPSVMKKRCSLEDRLARLQETGGTPECEKAVSKALDWFKATQSADGSWTGSRQPAMTGLALLAFLGRCETPLSKDYGDTVLRGITYLVDHGMRHDGKLASDYLDKQWCYEHSIATYALAEASTFCKQGNINIPNLFDVTRKAGQFIIDNQNKNGGWAYSYAREGGHTDTSVTAWQIQALKACHHTGLEFKGLDRAARRAMDYMESMVNSQGGVGYNSPGSTHAHGYFSMSGGGLLSLQMFGKGSSLVSRRIASYIEKNTRFEYDGPYSDLYGHYYEAQAMLNRGGAQWRKYNDLFRDQVLKSQNPDGSWKAPNKGSSQGIRAVGAEFVGNVHYRTALCTLMLEVYYRFLPGTGVGTR